MPASAGTKGGSGLPVTPSRTEPVGSDGTLRSAGASHAQSAPDSIGDSSAPPPWRLSGGRGEVPGAPGWPRALLYDGAAAQWLRRSLLIKTAREGPHSLPSDRGLRRFKLIRHRDAQGTPGLVLLHLSRLRLRSRFTLERTEPCANAAAREGGEPWFTRLTSATPGHGLRRTAQQLSDFSVKCPW
jgi:hypothetical protein